MGGSSPTAENPSVDRMHLVWIQLLDREECSVLDWLAWCQYAGFLGINCGRAIVDVDCSIFLTGHSHSHGTEEIAYLYVNACLFKGFATCGLLKCLPIVHET